MSNNETTAPYFPQGHVRKSEQINELAGALARVQAVMKPAPKTASNPFFNSMFADLKDVIECSRELLTKEGLAVIQLPCILEGGKAGLEVWLVHTSGQWISGAYPVNPVKTDPQSLGAAYTYARRYSYSMITGVVTEDDDGNHASGKGGKEEKPPAQQQRPAAQPKPAPKPAPAAQVGDGANIRQAMNTGDWGKVQATEPQRKRMFALSKEAGYDNAQLKDLLHSLFGDAVMDETGQDVTTMGLTQKMMDRVYKVLEKDIATKGSKKSK